MQHVDPIYQIPVWQGQLADSKALHATITIVQQALPEWHAQSVEQRHSIIQSWLTICQQQLVLLSKTLSSTTGIPLRQSKQLLETWCNYKPSSISMESTNKGLSVLIINTVDFQPWHILLKILAQGNAVVLITTPAFAAVWELLQQYWKQQSPIPALHGLIMDQLVQEGWQTLPMDSLLYFGNRALAMQLHQQLAGRYNLSTEFVVPLLQTAVITEAPSSSDSMDTIMRWAYEASGQKLGALKRLILLDTAENKVWLQRLLNAIKSMRVAAYDASPDPVVSSMISAKLGEQTLETYRQWQQQKGAQVLVPLRRLLGGTGMLTPGAVQLSAEKALTLSEVTPGPLLQIVMVADIDTAANLINSVKPLPYALHWGNEAQHKLLAKSCFATAVVQTAEIGDVAYQKIWACAS